MIPERIVREAERKGLDVIAITDHNTVENAGSVIEAAQGSAVKVLPGIECWSREDIHVLSIFDDLDDALSLQEMIYARLPQTEADVTFSQQLKVSAQGDFRGFNEHLCSMPADISLNDLIAATHELRGAAILAHVDRPRTSVISSFGFVPENVAADGLEVSKSTTVRDALERFPSLRGWPIVTSSDAHTLADIGTARTVFYLEECTAADLKLALAEVGGRRSELPACERERPQVDGVRS